MNLFFNLFLLFIIYAFLGWLAEVVYTSLQEKKLINRGFLIGPYCPIYGVSALIMILYLNQYSNNPLTVFILAVVICGILEYFTSYAMEKIFHAKWWDYSDIKFNLNGRICLKFLIAFGILSLLLIYLINPFITNILSNFPTSLLTILSIILMAIFVTDLVSTLNISYRLRKTINAIYGKTKEITKELVAESIEKNKTFQKRLVRSFPKFHPVVPKRKK